MKQIDKQCIEILADFSIGKLPSQQKILTMLQDSIQVFLQELCHMVKESVDLFNSLLISVSPKSCCTLLSLSQPRCGFIILKGNEKLIITLEGKFVRIRMVQLHGLIERYIHNLEFVAVQNELGLVTWLNSTDKQMVNPELVIHQYLSPFLVSGCRAFPAISPRLVALNSGSNK